jgi:hypothetical protein
VMSAYYFRRALYHEFQSRFWVLGFGPVREALLAKYKVHQWFP